MRPLIAGNWKMHGLSADVAAIAVPLRVPAETLGCDLLVCPPATLIAAVAAALAGSKVAVGAQDCHAKHAGPHTGEVSAAMLKDAGAAWVILGHSERRADHAETDAIVRDKAEAAIGCGLTPIICVGETGTQRQAGQQEAVVGGQLAGSLPDDFAGIVAYEPIWAIGTGHIPTAADVIAMHAFIRAQLVRRFGAVGQGVRILYGGSVKPANAAALLNLPEVGGALVGGASLLPADFLAVAQSIITKS
jgi:triosephosphate isomerase